MEKLERHRFSENNNKLEIRNLYSTDKQCQLGIVLFPGSDLSSNAQRRAAKDLMIKIRKSLKSIKINRLNHKGLKQINKEHYKIEGLFIIYNHLEDVQLSKVADQKHKKNTQMTKFVLHIGGGRAGIQMAPFILFLLFPEEIGRRTFSLVQFFCWNNAQDLEWFYIRTSNRF